MSLFIIYCQTNTINGKKYVGQTKLSIERRWREHVLDAKRGDGCRAIGAAIRKYGEQAFMGEVIGHADSQVEANLLEIECIRRVDCRSPRGYNLDAGGRTHIERHPETLRLMGEKTRQRMLQNPEARFRLARWNAENTTLEMHRERGRRTYEAMTADQINRLRSGNAAITHEQRIECGKRAYKSMTVDQIARLQASSAAVTHEKRSESAHAWQAKLTPEQRSENSKRAAASLTPEERSNIAIRRQAAKSPEKRREQALKAWNTKRRCLNGDDRA
jgi:hypothetical protein